MEPSELADVEHGHLLSPMALAMTATRGLPRPYLYADHLQLLSNELVQLRMRPAGWPRRLMVMMPPRHGKSETCSHWFPVWDLALDPSDRVIAASYEAEFAAKWGRAARRSMEEHYPIIGTRIIEDSRAAHRWETPQGGGMTTAGVGGPLMGRGGNLMICDDPIKNAEEANSRTIRDHLWDWWQSTFLTRLEPQGIVVLIMCMTGDTPVLMADGAETPLREIRAGDRIATYENGEITTAIVRRWARQGPDSVVEIRTRSGSIVRANARHPFLVARDGGVEWRRTGALRRGDEILRVTGGSGAASRARSMAAAGQPAAEGSARLITERPAGQAGLGRHLPTLAIAARRAFDSVMELASRSMSAFCLNKVASALSAAFRLPAATHALIGQENSASIMGTMEAGSGGFFATTATSPSATERAREFSNTPQPTYAVTRDPIVSITDAGIEDVFDIQVDRTENFIAGGLVAHNTRWHEDDLAGRILASPEAKFWRVITLPALADDDSDALGRVSGQALWPERYDELALENIRAEVGSRVFSALYQQRPSPAEGAGINRGWWQWYDEAPKIEEFDQIIQSWDPTFKAVDTSDYVAAGVIGRRGGDIFVLDGIRKRMNGPDTIKAIEAVDKQWPAARWLLMEDTASGSMICDILERERGNIIRIRPKGGKETRLHWGVNATAAVVERGKVWLPRGRSWALQLVDEAAQFPHAQHDDLIDMLVQGINHLLPRTWSWENLEARRKGVPELTTFEQLHHYQLHQAIKKKLAEAQKEPRRRKGSDDFMGGI